MSRCCPPASSSSSSPSFWMPWPIAVWRAGSSGASERQGVAALGGLRRVHGNVLSLRRGGDVCGYRSPDGRQNGFLRRGFRVRRGDFAQQLRLEHARDEKAVHRSAGRIPRLLRGEPQDAHDRRVGRRDLGRGHLAQPHRLGACRLRDLLRARPGRHDGRGNLGRIHLEGVSRRLPPARPSCWPPCSAAFWRDSCLLCSRAHFRTICPHRAGGIGRRSDFGVRARGKRRSQRHPGLSRFRTLLASPE